MGYKAPVLIVDDNRLMVKTLTDIFRFKGYRTDIAYSAMEAIQKIEKHTFLCVLSDIRMPGLDGLSLFRMVKNKRPTLPVILMTAFTKDDLIQQGLSEGVVAVLKKPLNLEDLFSLILSLNKQKQKLIVIDDDQNLLEAITVQLKVNNLKFQIINQLDDFKYIEAKEIILVNIKLRQIDELTTLREIRQRYPVLPISLLTEYQDDTKSLSILSVNTTNQACFFKQFQLKHLSQILTQLHHLTATQPIKRDFAFA